MPQKQALKHQPSLVRRLGFLFFWSKAQRIYLVWKEDGSESSSSYSDHESESSFLSHQLAETTALVENNDSDQMGTRIEEMQKEIIQLQAQLSQIILKMAAVSEEKNSFQDKEEVLSTKLPTTGIFQPPPPPPLPPLPPCPWHGNRYVAAKVRTGEKKAEMKTFSIAEELATKLPKLRHVELSPGGRPVRIVSKCASTTTNSDILTNVLRKRFEAIHSP